ncbi:hypothetical protein GXW74_27330 [Roseomonas eburnea]|uniref:Uncharacterized protein n=1 Tax=Neoroseomonas eburnea TaxID=1346889 RepID=A0A9X9XKH2_9PROT|nr:hypothetical protein [Neoroseomonas eburnea]MBR0684208.1 hypothetical protein [Neoroseomonas eburnea]
MRRLLPLPILALLLAPAARAQEATGRLCTARFAAGDPLPLEHRLVGFLAGDGCTAGDLLHFIFAGDGLAAAVAARHCRFDRPVLVDRGPETHLVCVWQGTMRSARP